MPINPKVLQITQLPGSSQALFFDYPRDRVNTNELIVLFRHNKQTFFRIVFSNSNEKRIEIVYRNNLTQTSDNSFIIFTLFCNATFRRYSHIAVTDMSIAIKIIINTKLELPRKLKI